MGTDNIKSNQAKQRREERKRKRRNNDSGRSSEIKKVLERVLIVSEGIKTEPIYFEKLVDFLKLVTTDIEVTGAKHSCPKRVVEYAIELFEEAKNTIKEYDLVFCVIDKDSHAKYEDALVYASKYTPKNILFIINSIPCFELWLLLHYEYTNKSFSKTVKNSICTALIKDDLKKYLPKYEKNISNLKDEDLNYIFNSRNIEIAIDRAKTLLKFCLNNDTDNPSTRIHELVEKLQEIKKRPHI